MGPNLIGKYWLWHHIKITTGQDLKNGSICNCKSYKSAKMDTQWCVFTKKMHFQCSVNQPRQVKNKYMIAMCLSIWRHADKCWRNSVAARGGSQGFWQTKFILLIQTIMNKYLIEHLCNNGN